MRGTQHRWREGDDLVALYLQQHGHTRLPYTVAEVARRLGISETTLRMRIGNFKALHGPGGLRKWAKQSERVYLENRDTGEPELRARVLAYLASIPAQAR
jgi:transposase-like protein